MDAAVGYPCPVFRGCLLACLGQAQGRAGQFLALAKILLADADIGLVQLVLHGDNAVYDGIVAFGDQLAVLDGECDLLCCLVAKRCLVLDQLIGAVGQTGDLMDCSFRGPAGNLFADFLTCRVFDLSHGQLRALKLFAVGRVYLADLDIGLVQLVSHGDNTVSGVLILDQLAVLDGECDLLCGLIAKRCLVLDQLIGTVGQAGDLVG